MGWLFYHKPRGEKLADHFRKKIECDNESLTYRALDVASTRSAVYAALEVTKKDTGRRYVTALVFLIKYIPRDKDGYNFGYKDMEESMGPYESECPERILKLLSPVEEIWPEPCSGRQYAAEWRARCQARVARRKTALAVKPGTTIRFEKPLKFTDGSEHRQFTLRRSGRKDVFVAQSGGDYRITRWRDRPFEIVA